VAGISARLVLTDDYHVLYELAAGAVGTALALEDERRKAEALAELDRAQRCLAGGAREGRIECPVTVHGLRHSSATSSGGKACWIRW
jgi:hypothetical protein